MNTEEEEEKETKLAKIDSRQIYYHCSRILSNVFIRLKKKEKEKKNSKAKSFSP